MKTPLKDIRKKIGLTQSQMASLLNIKQSEVSHLENGLRRPSLKTGINIARIAREHNIEITLDELFFPASHDY